MGDITKNFSRKEFACKCGCGKDDISTKLVEICQVIRDRVDVPITISSGCRCEKHNKKVGGVPNSYHTQGLAADLHADNTIGGAGLYIAIKDLFDEGLIPDLAYCIYYKKKNFCHIDIGKKRSNRFVINNG